MHIHVRASPPTTHDALPACHGEAQKNKKNNQSSELQTLTEAEAREVS
jgi:hypothetical protein